MRRILVLCIGLGLAACAGSRSERPQAEVPSSVSSVDTAMLLGTWSCRESNPQPGAPRTATTLTFDTDGTFVNDGRAEGGPMTSPMLIDARGRWRVEGARILLSNISAVAEPENSIPTLKALGGNRAIANYATIEQTLPGEILRLTAHEFSVRAVESPLIIACMR